jgi:hypothetical protein
MPDGESIAGHWLTGRSRTGEVGVWADTVTPDGSRAGALRLDPLSMSAPGARERVVAAVNADRRLLQSGLTGLMPIADLVAARGDVWLLTGRPATPSLAELMNGRPGLPPPDAGSAATVLVETAQTLLAVHAAGLAHGALHAGTVVIGDDGTALLAERGLVTALRGDQASPDRDLAAWASLARGLGAGWAADDPRAAQLFDRAAAAATTHGLSAARDALLSGRDLLPTGFTTRERLVRTIQWWSASDVQTQEPPRPYDPPGSYVGSGLPGPGGGEVLTLLSPPATGDSPHHGVAIGGAAVAGGIAAAGFAGGAHAATAGATGATEAARSGEVRFGPGVPADTTAAQIWRQGREQVTVPAKERLRRPPAKRRRSALWSGLLLLLILVAAIFLWLQRGDPLSVTAVDVKAPKAKGCDITVNITGKITTNGSAGQIKYQWWRSDKKDPIEQTDTVPSGQTAYEVSLPWTVKGQGSKKLTARLRVLSPIGSGTPLEDKASFTYKC